MEKALEFSKKYVTIDEQTKKRYEAEIAQAAAQPLPEDDDDDLAGSSFSRTRSQSPSMKVGFFYFHNSLTRLSSFFLFLNHPFHWHVSSRGDNGLEEKSSRNNNPLVSQQHTSLAPCSSGNILFRQHAARRPCSSSAITF